MPTDPHPLLLKRSVTPVLTIDAPALGHVGAVGGPRVAPGPGLAARDRGTIERLAREACALRP